MSPDARDHEGLQPASDAALLIEAGETDLTRYLEVDRSLVGGLGGGEVEILDLSRGPGWSGLDPEFQDRVVSLAARFLTESANAADREEPLSYLGRMHLRAMVLLQHYPNVQATLDLRVWERFGPLALSYPRSSSAKEERQGLLDTTFEKAPAALAAALNARLSYAADDIPALIGLMPARSWPSLLPEVVAVSCSLSDPGRIGEILTELLGRGLRPVLPQIRSMLSEGNLKARVAALLALAGYRPHFGGRLLAACVQAEKQVGEAVLHAWLTGQRHGSPMLDRLPDRVLGDLYIWLAKGPAAFVPNRDGRPVSDFDASIRDGIMRLLVTRGALTEVRRVADAVPEAPVVRTSVGVARSTVRREHWQAPTPADILRLVADRRRRLVSGADELVDVVVELLGDLQHDLRGDTPMAYLLWNNVARRKGTRRPAANPKDEESLSDFLRWYLKLRLQDRGIILNREVQIRRGGDGWQGERLDLLVEAVSPARDLVSVVVEVKGSWNPDWDSGMASQLVGRYLKENRGRPGIYLLGYFHPGPKAGSLPLKEVRRTLQDQASAFRSGGQRVEAVVLDFTLT